MDIFIVDVNDFGENIDLVLCLLYLYKKFDLQSTGKE